MQKKDSVLKISSESQLEENSEEDSNHVDDDGVNEAKEHVQLPPDLIHNLLVKYSQRQ